MSQGNAEDITYESIYNLLSHYIRAEHDALWKDFKEEKSYKRLIRHGEKQYFESPIESTFEEESRKAKMNFAEINLLALEVDKDISEIIQKKLDGEFRKKLKEEVLNVLLKLTSKQKRNDNKSSPTQAEINRKMMEERAVYEKIKYLSEYCAENMNDIRKQVHEMPEEEEVVIKTEYEEMETDETQDDPNQTEESENDSNQQSKNKADTPPPAAAAPENDHSSASCKPQRIRKPNMRYAKDNVVFSPARNSFELDIENIISGTNQVTTPEKETPRRRGRPRKHLE